MEFASGKKEVLESIPKGKAKIAVGVEDLLEYPHPINFYSVPPSGEIELDEAEDLVTERIRCKHLCQSLEFDFNNLFQY